MRTAAEVLQNWDSLKRQEKAIESHTESLRSVPAAFPALLYAYKVCSRAYKSGVTPEIFASPEEKLVAALQKVLEKCESTEEELTCALGELLFAIAVFSAPRKLQCELALKERVAKFITEFSDKEQQNNK